MGSSSITSNILSINLSNEKISIEHPEDIFYRRYFGGQGFISYYLLKELEKGINPLGPKNKLIFAAGPITGVPIAGAGRHAVGAKSPLTGGYGQAEVGGYWGAELKKAGFDAIIIEGRAKDPVYLWIKDGKVQLRDANHIWGKVTGDVQRILKKENEEKLLRIAQIGPGGENLIPYACVINELRDAAGRCGLGAVMGSKNLKAIAIRGTKRLEINSKDKLSEVRKIFNEKLLKPYSEVFAYGTPVSGTMQKFVQAGNLPIRNFRDGVFQAEGLDPRNVDKELNLKKEGCFACPLRCKKVISVDEKWDYDSTYGGPEYETLAAFGSNCGINDFEAVAKANEICNKYSIDTISAGVSIGFAMECFEKGILTEEETDGIELRFGNVDAMLNALECLCKRKGFGDFLAKGTKRMAEIKGQDTKTYAIQVKGQEIPMHEPRLKQALGVGYAVSPTGPDHMHNLHDTAISNKASIKSFHSLGILEPLPLDDLGAKKMRALMYHMNMRMMENCLVMCFFIPWDLHYLNAIVRAGTGFNTTCWELMKLGERVTTLARIFNLREGITKKDDMLPERFFNPTTSGILSGTSIDKSKFKEALEIYYQMMGWDENGIPTKIKLAELDISWAEDFLP
ncbi:MAG: aldehyde ferredoxin oxidoreductase [Candidatus Lokiarchaeota archaeon]|nr:aldehyde ferredoxin oxidoreductase [Candidatus Lokiarchaeota archaeon]MBD3201231.1 aldehyde ferredoxin oxidoreductase [Candidatus Lokiarchaeota archaeon]